MLPCELPEATASVATGIATGRLMIHHQNLNQPQSFGDFGHGCFSRLYTKLTCLPFSYHYHHRSKGTTSLPRCWRRGATTRKTSLQTRSTGEAQLVPFHLLLLQLHPSSQPEQGPTTSLQSLFVQTTMEPLPHGLWSCSSKPLTGRTGHYRLRDASVYWNHWRYTLDIQESLPLPDKDSSHDDMPCRTPLH